MSDGTVASDLRADPHTGARVYIVGSRQARPNLPSAACPFCPGGLDAPAPYDVRWFPNRWPAMPGERCEVILVLLQPDRARGGRAGAAGGGQHDPHLDARGSRRRAEREEVAHRSGVTAERAADRVSR